MLEDRACCGGGTLRTAEAVVKLAEEGAVSVEAPAVFVGDSAAAVEERAGATKKISFLQVTGLTIAQMEAEPTMLTISLYAAST